MRHKDSKFRSRAESGQAIVLLALVIVALVGITGLAIDGGGLFFLQRDAQNAADAAAVASTYALCTYGTVDQIVASGQAAAQQNGFINGQDGRIVTVAYPPTFGPKAGDSDYVEVDITATKPAYFIQVVYKGPLQVSVRAIGFCQEAFDPATVPAIFGISSTCTNAVRMAASDGLIDGGVFSNTEAQFTGSNNELYGEFEAVTTVDDPSSNNNTYYTAGQPVSNYPGGVQPDPLANVYHIDDYKPGTDLTNTILSGGYKYFPITQGSDSSAPNYDPDYNDGNSTWHLNNRMLEGLYYVEGDVVLGANVTVGPAGVSIVATGSITGSAGGDGINISYYDYVGATGVLFFSGKTTTCGSNAISVSGNIQEWHGLVYAPNGGVGISGSQLTVYGAIVANTVTLDGSMVSVYADPTVIPPKPPLVKLSE